MKVLGVKQLQQKTYKMLPINEPWRSTLGNIPKSFHCIVCGKRGNGKTEFCIRLAKELTKYGIVAWLSYEQGHDVDLQAATFRNNMQEVAGKFYAIDPVQNLAPGVSLFTDLCNYLKKRGSPDFIFMDSVDYTRFTIEEYFYLKKTFKNKAFIWISHMEGKHPKSTTGKAIDYDGQISVIVRDYIAYPEKNRFGGFVPYVVYEERARLLNPKFFATPAQPKAPVADLFTVAQQGDNGTEED